MSVKISVRYAWHIRMILLFSTSRLKCQYRDVAETVLEGKLWVPCSNGAWKEGAVQLWQTRSSGLVCGRVQIDWDIGELSSINGGHLRKKNFASESLNIFRIDEVLCAVAWYAKWAN